VFAGTRLSILAGLARDGSTIASAPTRRTVGGNLAPSIFSLARVDAESGGAIDAVVPVGHHAMERVIALGQPIYVRGWAVDVHAATLASRVVLAIDGVLQFTATYGFARADIANAFGVPEFSRSGFEAVIPPVLGLGSHNVAACAVSADGTSYVTVAVAAFHVIASLIPRPFDHAPDERGDGALLTVTTDGDTRSIVQRAGRTELAFDAGVIVRGWARPSRGSYAEVGIVVDDRWYVEGTPATAGRPGSYEARFVLNFAVPGDHQLYAVARMARGSFVRVSDRVSFESIEAPLPWMWALVELRQPTRAAIDEISCHDGSLTALPCGSAIFLRGWATDEPAGAAAGGVYISIDGDRISPIVGRYGRANDPYGFTAVIPTDTLSSGSHTLELLVTARSWSGYYVPLPPVLFNILPQRTIA
jgi:hypothetical protein